MKITILTFFSAFLPFPWPAFLPMGHQWCVPQPGLAACWGHTGWLCLPGVLHLLGRGVKRNRWISNSLLVSLFMWQIRGVPGAGCSLQECCGVMVHRVLFLCQRSRNFFPWFFGKAVVHSKGICDTGSYLLRLLGISNFVFLFWKWMDAGSSPVAWGFL